MNEINDPTDKALLARSLVLCNAILMYKPIKDLKDWAIYLKKDIEEYTKHP